MNENKINNLNNDNIKTFNINKIKLNDEKELSIIKKQTPNQFLGIKLFDKNFHGCVYSLRTKMLEKADQIEKQFVPVEKLHITMFVIELTNLDQIEKSKELLNSCKDQFCNLFNNKSGSIKFGKLEQFKKNVIQLSPCKNETLDKIYKLNEYIKQVFLHSDLSDQVKDEKNWIPHVTIAKLSRDRRGSKEHKKLGLREEQQSGLEHIFDGINIKFSSIDLFAMHNPIATDGCQRSILNINLK